MTAILLAAGKRVKAGAGGHVELVRSTRQHLPDHAELFVALDALRAERNRVAYDGEDPSRSEVDALEQIADELIGIAEKSVKADR